MIRICSILNKSSALFYVRRFVSEKQVNFEIIVEAPFLIKVILLCTHNILRVLLKDIGIYKWDSVVLHDNTPTPSFRLIRCHYPTTLSILAFQFPLKSMTVSYHLCHLLAQYMKIYLQHCY